MTTPNTGLNNLGGLLPEKTALRREHFNKGSSENLVAEPDGEVEVPEEEEDARAVVLERSKATRGGFDLLDFAVKAQRWRGWHVLMTVPSATLRASKRVVVPLRL